MPFAYTDEQAAFAKAVTGTLRRRCPMTVVRATIADPDSWRNVWREMVGLELPGLLVPESLGGVGLTPVDLAGALEAAGHFCAPVPLVATLGAFTPILLAAGADDPAALPIIARVLSGTPATVVPIEVGPAARALPRLRDGRLTGRCAGIPDASRAELIAVPAVADAGETVLIVADAAQLGLTWSEAMDPTSPVGQLELDEQEIGDALVLGGDLTPAWPIAWTAAAAELVGLAAELVSVSVAYAKERTQFGKPIGSFQGIKHQLADAHLAVERARSLTMYAAGLCSQPGAGSEPAVQRAAHQAKALASEAGSRAARIGVQTHGGLGITKDNDISLLYLRARQLGILFGGADGHYAQAAAVAAGGVVTPA